MADDVVFSPDGSRIYVSNMLGGTGLESKPVPGREGAFSSSLSDEPATVSVVDAGKLEVRKTIEVGMFATRIGLAPNGRTLYVANSNMNGEPQIAVVDTRSERTTYQIRLNTALNAAADGETGTCR
jgi:DNA-binding beta-propeller fold protein YncE